MATTFAPLATLNPGTRPSSRTDRNMGSGSSKVDCLHRFEAPPTRCSHLISTRRTTFFPSHQAFVCAFSRPPCSPHPLASSHLPPRVTLNTDQHSPVLPATEIATASLPRRIPPRSQKTFRVAAVDSALSTMGQSQMPIFMSDLSLSAPIPITTRHQMGRAVIWTPSSLRRILRLRAVAV